MLGSRSSTRSLAFVALISLGCSLGDFGYLSADFGHGHSGDTALGGAAGASRGGDGGASGNATSGEAQGGSLPNAGAAAGGSAATAGTGSSDVESQFFCDPKYAVFDAAAGGAPPVDLPETGDYVVHRQGPRLTCLITPDWPELEDHRYWAIAHDCGAPDALTVTVDDVWHLEHLCSDVYRFTTHHGTDTERQLAIKDQAAVGTPLYSVPYVAAATNYEPSMLFHLRFEELLGTVVRWRFSPVIQASSCVEETGQAHYGQLDVARVVLYPCTGSLSNQSWNLLSSP